MLRAATEADFGFLRSFSNEPGDAQLGAQIRDGRLRIIEPADVPVGFIKCYVLWETLPFMEVITLREDWRGRGLGREAVRRWEREMAAHSFPRVVISTEADGPAREFWRRIGYEDCGSLNLPGRPIELFMFRDVSVTAAEPDAAPDPAA